MVRVSIAEALLEVVRKADRARPAAALAGGEVESLIAELVVAADAGGHRVIVKASADSGDRHVRVGASHACRDDAFAGLVDGHVADADDTMACGHRFVLEGFDRSADTGANI